MTPVTLTPVAVVAPQVTPVILAAGQVMAVLQVAVAVRAVRHRVVSPSSRRRRARRSRCRVSTPLQTAQYGIRNYAAPVAANGLHDPANYQAAPALPGVAIRIRG